MPAKSPYKPPPEGAAHANSHMVRVDDTAWQRLRSIAMRENRTMIAQFSVILEDFAQRNGFE